MTDRRAASPGALAGALFPLISNAVAAGADWIQIREKDLSGRALLDLVRRAVALAGTRSRVLVNDRLDVAWAAGAGGVHLGGSSVPTREVVRWRRGRVDPRDFLIGVSCHTVGEVREAAESGADYVIFGPLFATPAKLRYGPPQGIERLAEACRAAAIPVLAIGGITQDNATDCLRAGAAGIAAIRLFQVGSGDLAAFVERIRSARGRTERT